MTEKVRIELPLLLPKVDDASDACVARLLENLSARDGVANAHIVAAQGEAPARLCIHYDPGLLPLSRIRHLAQSEGTRITEQFGHVRWTVEGLSSQRRARTVAERLLRTPGIVEADASASGTVRVDFDREAITEPDIRRLLAGMALSVKGEQIAGSASAVSPSIAANDDDADHDHASGDHKGHDHGTDAGDNKHDHGSDEGGDGHDHAHGGIFGANTEIIFAIACGATAAIGFAIEKLTSAPGWLPLAFYLMAYAFGGYFTLREAIDNLRMKRFEIDTLMLVAACGAAALGAWAEGALLLFLFSMGHSLEHYAMGRAKRAIEALAELAPQSALVRREGQTVEIPVEQLAVGDVVIVKPNERMPADGFVLVGTSSVNQAPVTGESIPVDKRPVDDPDAAASQPDKVGAAYRIFAGTINGAGAIEVQVTRLSKDTTLAKVVQMVGEAEAQKSPTQRFTDRFERIFVPAVLGLVVVLLFAWVVVDEPFRDSFYRAMAVLVAASPCALAIATPSAVLSGIARAARGGVLVKGGGPLENLGTLRAIAFDKTGTLTEGKPRISDIVPADGTDEKELLRIAIAVESLSDHPLAAAITAGGRERLGDTAIPPATDLRSITGRGVQATVEGELVHVGSPKLFGEADGSAMPQALQDEAKRLEEAGRTTMVIRKGARYLGIIGVMDTPRPAAVATLARLRELGITRMIMISGDNQRVADAIAKEVGLDEAWGDLMPEDKVAAIKKLKAEDKVAMVGDGVNDAPAMANATVGIAMGAAGSDVALETADVALMADDLAHLPFAVGLSRQTSRIIRQNLFMSLGVVTVLLPATILGLGIGPAVLAHEGSTLVVVFNALRLLAFKDRSDV
ncbi:MULTISPECIES: heavy metal translocating P-type ATPase [unclassified Sphingomonas]|uniref:heavy metal translocating P-type ATPase n=1 Tax=unclassified Sphingomonas TaxID=196159 RepID=UPI000700D8EA|nr:MULTISPECIES: heavy metal translocating P-type ATPase [unclassified Sphingomonas]KQX19166.1 ATPase [Sphingomonas sp. Root1294]KQY65367.1 ATPase [Sphingomonas sp. Root50]KRB95339.1 ATPase [Sphingomonas sp. Root720]